MEINHKGYILFIDEEDYELFKNRTWSVIYFGGNTRYLRSGGPCWSYFHRVIMGLPNNDKRRIDHINGNGLDNRRSNLRFATIAQNAHNSIKVDGKLYNGKPTSSKYKGVSYYKRDKNYSAFIAVNNKKKHLGYFNNEIDAAIAYNEAAKTYFGEFASLNKI